MSLSPPTSEGLGKRLKLTKAHRITQLHSKGTKHGSPQLLAQSLCLASAKISHMHRLSAFSQPTHRQGNRQTEGLALSHKEEENSPCSRNKAEVVHIIILTLRVNR